MTSQFSPKVSEILAFSREEATRLASSYVGPEHLLLGILREKTSPVADLFRQLNINSQTIKEELEEKVREDEIAEPVDTSELALNNQASNILRLAVLEARLQHTQLVDVQHLLLAMLHDHADNAAKEVLEKNDLDYETALRLLSKPATKDGIGLPDEDMDDADEDNPSAKQGNDNARQQATATQPQGNGKTPVIDNFSVDLTKAAAEGKLDPVVGREKEIQRVVSLDMTAIVAGTKYRGQFEERIRALLKELESNPNIIVFIDEIHTIIGAGSTPGSMDAANIMKPALARGVIQCIGATTVDEYRKSIEKDGALERRFQKVMVEPTTKDETLQILANIKERYEEHHHVSYTDDALKEAVRLADRYITDRFMPDKAIDIIDEVGSRVHLRNAKVPQEITDKENEIEAVKQKKQEAVGAQNFELAASYRDKQTELEQDLRRMQQEWQKDEAQTRQTVTESEVASVVSMMTGIPVQRMAEAEGKRLRNMGAELKKVVIGQDGAIEKMVKAIQRNRVGLKDPNHPIGAFMFLGPTGVGKTYLAKRLAEKMFGSKDALIRVDMSEFTESFNVSRLVGAPPGYVGYDEGGQLTEQVRRHPYSIVLLDEIEKAHGNVFNLLLQVLDEGRLTDGNGRLVDFRNTVIIMTSNAGTRQLKEFSRGVGFNAGGITNAANMDSKDKQYARSIIQKSLAKQFSPEFLNRLDEIITFDQLDLDAIKRIIDIELAGLHKRVAELGLTISLTDKAKELVATTGYDIQFGARPLKRAIQTYIEDGIAEMILSEETSEGDTIVVDKADDKDELTFSDRKPETTSEKPVSQE